MSVIVKGGGGAAKQEKTVTAGTYAKEVFPDTGKLLSKVVVNPTPSQSKTVTPSTSQQTVSPDSGKLLSQVIVEAMEDVTPEVTAQMPIITEIIEGLVGKAQGATATADKILEGYSAYVGGVLVYGTYEPIKAAKGSFSVSSDSNKVTVNHNLGVKPTFIAVYTHQSTKAEGFTFGYAGPMSDSNYYLRGYYQSFYRGGLFINGSGNMSFDETSITFGLDTAEYFAPGVTYEWVAFV